MSTTTCAADWRTWWCAGDWRPLFAPVWRMARAVALPLVRHLPDARDVAEDVASGVVARCIALPYVPHTPPTFVATMAHRLALDTLKRGAVRFADDTEAGHAAYTSAVSPDADPLDALIAEETRREVRRTLGALRPDVAAYLLARAHELTPEQIAARTRTTRGAVMMRLHRARHAFRAEYGASHLARAS